MLLDTDNEDDYTGELTQVIQDLLERGGEALVRRGIDRLQTIAGNYFNPPASSTPSHSEPPVLSQTGAKRRAVAGLKTPSPKPSIKYDRCCFMDT